MKGVLFFYHVVLLLDWTEKFNYLLVNEVFFDLGIDETYESAFCANTFTSYVSCQTLSCMSC